MSFAYVRPILTAVAVLSFTLNFYFLGRLLNWSFWNDAHSQGGGSAALPSLGTSVRNRTSVIEIPKSWIIHTYLVHSSTCKIPRVPIFYEGYVRRPYAGLDCSHIMTMADFDILSQVIRLPRRKQFNCTVTSINRDLRNGSSFVLGRPTIIKDSLSLKRTELFVINCASRLSRTFGMEPFFEANFPLKASVQKKLNFWRSGGRGGRKAAVNVVWLVIQASSRAHFYRSLPKTMRMLGEMDFVDFKGYHSIGAGTSENLLPCLLGLSASQARETCAAQDAGTDNYDSCPSLWKEFNRQKYVTMHAGNNNQPREFPTAFTDYSPQPLFLAADSIRKQRREGDKSGSCVNNLNPPSFLLEYTKRFMRKLGAQQLPFVAFTWINDDATTHFQGLAGLDEKITSLLKYFWASKGLRERTMFIISSDQGHPSGEGLELKKHPETVIERSLPGLFIRLPDTLKMYSKVLKTNADKLITGYDVHHTLLHLLNLESSSSFGPRWWNRSSLLLPIGNYRSCESVGIQRSTCVCNTSRNIKAWEDALTMQILISFALKELNSLISNSKYSGFCSRYQSHSSAFDGASVIRTSNTSTDGFIRFKTVPHAVFEVRLQVLHKASSFDGVERLGDFRRLTNFENSSWCVGPLAGPDDKDIKALCTCK